MSTTIQHVSDTALWVAAFRAKETARPDAVFRDSFARDLAGEKGLDMLARTPDSHILAFIITVRTTGIDTLVQKAVELGADAVINLGAGLDSRPYRMNLPKDLKWFEVDFPGIIDYKTKILANKTPVCQLQRLKADLSNINEREQVFASLNAQVKKALVITEGVIPYLTNDEGASLSQSIYDMPNVQYWIQEYRRGTAYRGRHSGGYYKMLQNSPFKFDSPEPLDFFGKQGWKVKQDIRMVDEGNRIGRSFPLRLPMRISRLFIRKKIDEVMNKSFGLVLFEK